MTIWSITLKPFCLLKFQCNFWVSWTIYCKIHKPILKRCWWFSRESAKHANIWLGVQYPLKKTAVKKSIHIFVKLFVLVQHLGAKSTVQSVKVFLAHLPKFLKKSSPIINERHLKNISWSKKEIMMPGLSQLHSPGWARVPLSSFFLKIDQFFLKFIFFLILVLQVGDLPTRKGPGYATGWCPAKIYFSHLQSQKMLKTHDSSL